MDTFTKKLQLIYDKLFENDIDRFTKAFINNNKFNIDKFNGKTEEESYEQFLFNRKIVLRRWLQKGKCTSDFKKSFKYYKISKYKYKGEPLFVLDDFKRDDNLLEFEKKIDGYIKEKERVNTPVDYKYLYLFDEDLKSIYFYKIIEWKKGEGLEMMIELSSSKENIEGRVFLEYGGNILITLTISQIKHYFLFHDNNDNYSKYTVGISMGFSKKDNKVPIAKKAVLSKDILDTNMLDLELILNNTEILCAVENRVSKNIDNFEINPFVKYTQRVKNYYLFFSELINKRFKKNFYYRLALKEFNSFRKLFEKVIHNESYFIYNYHRAFYEMLKSVEEIGDIPLYIVQEFSSNHYLVNRGYQEIKIQERLFNLVNYGIEVKFIVVLDSNLEKEVKLAMDNMSKRGIDIRVVKKDKIINQVNSIDFAFIKTGTREDFVLADPLRDSKDVYKVFTNIITMEEYYSDYYKIFSNSEVYNISTDKEKRK